MTSTVSFTADCTSLMPDGENPLFLDIRLTNSSRPSVHSALKFRLSCTGSAFWRGRKLTLPPPA